MARGEVKSARLIEVIETRCTRGHGTTDSPYRLVVQYWDKEGNMLAEYDSINERQ